MMRDVAPAEAHSAQAGNDADLFPVTPAPEADALEWLWRRRYAPDGHSTVCQTCGRPRRFHRVAGRRAYACDHCGRQIYPAAATLFRGSVIPLETWFAAAAAIYHDPSLPPARLAGASRAWPAESSPVLLASPGGRCGYKSLVYRYTLRSRVMCTVAEPV